LGLPSQFSSRNDVRHGGVTGAPCTIGRKLRPSTLGWDTPARAANVGAQSVFTIMCVSVRGVFVIGS
jgi:hypothetical protein